MVRGNKLCLAKNTVAAEIDAKQIQLEELRQRLVTDVRMRYFELLIASKQVALTTKLVELSQNAENVSRQLVDAKELARTSLLQAELELQKAELNLNRASNDVVARPQEFSCLG